MPTDRGVPMDECLCGSDVKHPKSGECGRCYQARYYSDRRLGVGRDPLMRPVATVRCPVCSLMFTTVVPSQQFCSRKCGASWSSVRRWDQPGARERAAASRRAWYAAQPTPETRRANCGCVLPYYEGRYIQKCDDCCGLTCKWPECAEAVPRNHKWCPVHRAVRARESSRAAADRPGTECSEDDCLRPVRAKGICNMHYKRVLRADGRMAPSVWDDRRKSNHHKRRARLATEPSEFVSMDDIVARDGTDCAWCSLPVDFDLKWPDQLSKSIDHAVPVSRGGSHTLANTQLMHLGCNSSKGNRNDSPSAAQCG